MMKKLILIKKVFPDISTDAKVFLKQQWHRRPVPIQLFLLMCLNLIITPAVYAATDGAIERKTVYALGLLGIVTLALSIYLFVVIFQPERF